MPNSTDKATIQQRMIDVVEYYNQLIKLSNLKNLSVHLLNNSEAWQRFVMSVPGDNVAKKIQAMKKLDALWQDDDINYETLDQPDWNYDSITAALDRFIDLREQKATALKRMDQISSNILNIEYQYHATLRFKIVNAKDLNELRNIMEYVQMLWPALSEDATRHSEQSLFQQLGVYQTLLIIDHLSNVLPFAPLACDKSDYSKEKAQVRMMRGLLIRHQEHSNIETSRQLITNMQVPSGQTSDAIAIFDSMVTTCSENSPHVTEGELQPCYPGTQALRRCIIYLLLGMECSNNPGKLKNPENAYRDLYDALIKDPKDLAEIITTFKKSHQRDLSSRFFRRSTRTTDQYFVDRLLELVSDIDAFDAKIQETTDLTQLYNKVHEWHFTKNTKQL